MKIINDKYYAGYEGEGEIQFIRYLSNGDKYSLRIWDGYFDELMNLIECEESGWTGMAYFYHVEEPWWEAPWRIPDLDIVIRQLQFIHIDQRNDNLESLRIEICNMLSSAKEWNEQVWIADV